MTPRILIVIPTYGAFDYALKAVRSAVENTRTLNPRVLVVDDATPGKLDGPGHPQYDAFAELCRASKDFCSSHPPLGPTFAPAPAVEFHEFKEHGGLTRSWNHGLAYANTHGFEFCCVANSDVIFAPNWDKGIFDALAFQGLDLAGPVTNTPGNTQEQYVGRYSALYRYKYADDLKHIAAVQNELNQAQWGRFKRTKINGFCMVALTDKWRKHAYDAEHVFRPRNDFYVNGQPNPNPLTEANEDEFQHRGAETGLKTGVALSSYVYHYRAVTRGDKHKKGDWYRAAGVT